MATPWSVFTKITPKNTVERDIVAGNMAQYGLSGLAQATNTMLQTSQIKANSLASAGAYSLNAQSSLGQIPIVDENIRNQIAASDVSYTNARDDLIRGYSNSGVMLAGSARKNVRTIQKQAQYQRAAIQKAGQQQKLELKLSAIMNSYMADVEKINAQAAGRIGIVSAVTSIASSLFQGYAAGKTETKRIK